MVIGTKVQQGECGAKKGPKGADLGGPQETINTHRQDQQMKYSRIIPCGKALPNKKQGAGIKGFGLPGRQPGNPKGGERVPKRDFPFPQGGQNRPPDGKVPGVVFRTSRVEVGMK